MFILISNDASLKGMETLNSIPTAMTSAQLVQSFRRFVALRAAREGVDVSGLQIEGATLEATWGDLAGFVFFGCTDAVNERVAECFEAYAQKHTHTGSYNAQRSIGLRGPRYFHEYVNGAKSWSSSETASKFTALARPIVKGYSVATTYFPCAD